MKPSRYVLYTMKRINGQWSTTCLGCGLYKMVGYPLADLPVLMLAHWDNCNA